MTDSKPRFVWRNSITDEPLEDALKLPERPQEATRGEETPQPRPSYPQGDSDA